MSGRNRIMGKGKGTAGGPYGENLCSSGFKM